MHEFLDVSKNQIAQLNDTDLRELIALLCKAELAKNSISRKFVSWGGDQNAADGGIDVKVDCRDEARALAIGYIPRKLTAIQVKKPDLTKGDVKKEMLNPDGSLKPAIKEILVAGGAYVIASSGADTSDSMLKSRLAGMQEAVQGEIVCAKDQLQFYDRQKIADWVRCFPSLVLWVKEKIGQPQYGWRPFGQWADSDPKCQGQYLYDSSERVEDLTGSSESHLTIVDAINRIREQLSAPKQIIRLVGLSGVGKTRFAQALFDEAVGENPLRINDVIYGDAADSLQPDSKSLAMQLAEIRTRTILIVDNCSPQEHKRLIDVCRQSRSQISILTIEYDIRENIQGETDVFRLHGLDQANLADLVKTRFPSLTRRDSYRIAEYSDRNCRIAIALANQLRKTKNTAQLQDEELFDRLFQQRHAEDHKLRAAARILAIVYSFDCDLSDKDSELLYLAAIANSTPEELYRYSSILLERGLVQERSNWRAVLPQAIANKLANEALGLIPPTSFSVLHSQWPTRLLTSLTRRLSYLHQSSTAKQIASSWLSKAGPIGIHLLSMDYCTKDIFQNLAAANPASALDAIERVLGSIPIEEIPKLTLKSFTKVLYHIGYSAEYFSRCVQALRMLLRSDKIASHARDHPMNCLSSSFQCINSGTTASLEERSRIVKELLESDSDSESQLGLELLSTALKTINLDTYSHDEFGTHDRSGIRRTMSATEIDQWFSCFIQICAEHATSDRPTARCARNVLAKRFTGLWARAERWELLSEIALAFHEQGGWIEGWHSILDLLGRGPDVIHVDLHGPLEDLELKLRPADLPSRILAVVLADDSRKHALGRFLLEGADAPNEWERVNLEAQDLGRAAGKNLKTVEQLWPQLFMAKTQAQYYFGLGIADSTITLSSTWQYLLSQFEGLPSDSRQTGILRGFMDGVLETHREEHHALLDRILAIPSIQHDFPFFQLHRNMDERDFNRIIKAIESEVCDVRGYKVLGWGRVHEAFSDDQIATLLEMMIPKKHGLATVIEILTMRAHGRDSAAAPYSMRLKSAALQVLRSFIKADELGGPGSSGYTIAGVALICIDRIGEAELDNIREQSIRMDLSLLLNLLAEKIPDKFLHAFGTAEHLSAISWHSSLRDERSNPFDKISSDLLIDWCQENPNERICVLIEATPLYHTVDGKLEWKPILQTLLELANSYERIVPELIDSLHPRSWGGSLADILIAREPLLDALINSAIPEVARLAALEEPRFRERIQSAQQRESSREKGPTSFE